MALKKKKNYNEILYELQKEAVLNKTGATDDQLKKQAAKQDFAQEKRYAPITKNNVVSNTYAKTSSKKTTTTTKKSSDGLFSAFDDGYDIGDISKTIITGGKMLLEGPVKVGKGLIEDPKQTIKSLGVSFAEGYNKASELVDNSVSDIIDYITPDSWKKDKKNTPSVNVLELDKFAATASDEEKQQVLQEYEDAYGKDSPAYQSTLEILYGNNKNIFNTKYYDTETYKKKESGELSEEQQEIYGVGENLGGMAYDYSLGYMTGGLLNPGSTKAIEIASKGSLFLRSQQSATEQAISEGYDEGKARLFGLTVGGFEVGLESIGFDEYGATKELAKKSILKIMGGEALEEFIMPYVEHGAKTLYFGEEFDLESASEEALKSAGIGALTGAIMSAGGRGYAKTDSVINKINTGKEVTENDIISAAKEIESNEPGTIESVINQGTEALKQDIEGNVETDTQKNITNQINELEGQLDTSMNPNQQQEVLNQINTLKEQYDTETQNITKQKQEQENAERELRRTNFTYDETKITDEVEKAVYDSATKYFNNTARSHEFVERVARISKDKGTRYSFINNEELQANGLNVEGKQVNGLVRTEQDGKPTILINIDSNKALNTIVGHETTHLLEGTQEYQELQQTIFEYAKTKGDLDTVRNNLTELYKDIENADIDSELTAELVGDYLFTDSKFIDSLAVEKPTLFQKIKELIDDLVVRFRGTKEERQLRQVQKAFKNAYSVSNSNNIDTKYSLNDNQGRTLTKEQQEYFKDSKVRDENGNLLTLYHGTPYAGFNVFDERSIGATDEAQGFEGSYLGEGFYFTDDKGYADEYTDRYYDYSNPEIKEVYLNIKNPYVVPDNLDYDYGMLFDEFGVDNNQDLTKKLKELGYDGINYKDGTEYVAFYPNQIKNIDNTNPTSDADIRYSLSEAGTHGDLMAIHNLSEEKMKGVIELGGFPVPSIAVTKSKNTGNNQFGRITVLFDKNTIDPSNRLNEVYDRDVWTPTFPSVEYDIDTNVLNNIRKITKTYYDYGNNKYLSEVSSKLNNLEYDINRAGLERTLENIKNSDAFKYAYLKQVNPNFKEITQTHNYSYDYSNESLKRFLDSYKGDTPLNELSFEQTNELIPLIKEAVRPELETKYAKYGEDGKAVIDEMLKSLDKYNKANSFIYSANSLNIHGDSVQETNVEATKELIDKEINQEVYEEWVDETFKDIISDKGIRNDKDPFTPSGNRRSFKVLHEPYDLTNIVKYMTKQKTVAGEEGFGAGSGFGTIQAQMANKFSSIDEIRNAANERIVPNIEEHDLLKPYSDTIYADMESLTEYYKYKDERYVYPMDNAGYALNDFAGYKTQNIANLKRALNENQFNVEDIPGELLNKIVKDVNSLKNIPTDYFEAKPQRAVGLNEVQAIVIPNDSSTEFKQLLQDNGIKYYEYDPTIEGDKQRVINQFDDLKFSLSKQGQDIAPTGDYNVYGDEVKLQVEEAIAPLQEKIEALSEQLDTVLDSSTQDIAPVEQVSTQPTKAELDNLMALQETGGTEYANEFFRLRDKYGQPKLYKGINEYKKSPNNYGMIEEGNLLTEAGLDEFYNQSSEVFKTITDEDAPMPMEDTTPDYEYEMPKVESPLEDRNIEEVGSRKVKAYQYEHPEVRPYFQEAALGMMYDLNNTTKGERIYNDEVYYNTNGEEGWMGIKRNTTDDIADLLDNFNYSYADIEKGLNAIIEDNGAENIAVAKRIEFALDDRLRNGYTGVDGLEIPANQGYIDLLREKEFSDYYSSIPSEDIAPIEMNLEENSVNVPETKNIAENTLKTSHEEIVAKPETTKEKPIEVKKSTNPIKPKTKGSTRDTLNYLFINRNEAIDRFAKETGNNNIKFLADHVNNVSGEISTNINKAQIDNNGSVIGKSIVDIFNQARKAKLTEAFDDYLFHLSNKARHKQGKGSLVPLTESKALIIEYEKAYPEMKKWAREVNKYNKQNLYKQVEADLYSKEFADGLVEKYEFYVPFFADVLKTYVPSDTKTIKTRGTVRLAEGGANRNLLSFEEAMIRQTQSAITAIRKNLLYQEIVDSSPQTPLGTDADANGLYADENGYYLTAKVNGENVSAYISEDLYRGLENKLGQQIRDIEQRMSGITKPLQAIGNIRRNILTTWSPSFIVTNPAKDIQDAPLNSKYAKDWAINYPIAFKELTLGKGEHLQEFLNMYGEAGIMGDYVIDSGVRDATKIAKTKKKIGGITRLNEMLELAPRYAEYLASIKNGTSQMEALYNAREVTTNFGRGGVITKALNRNGFTFLNASVQGFNKLYRNFSGENGAKGVVNASLKAVMFGVVPALFNALSYDDDEDYEALPDYIKDNYYLYKTDDGEFIRIPKGRMMSIFGSAARRALEAVQGEEDAFEGYLTNAYSQVGIQNPMESNIFAPLLQAYGSKNGKTWYGTDLVPTRLQDVPVEEQYDESTDKFSIWLGQTFGISPYKVNYVFDQYSGGIGDLLLPTITEEANSDGSFLAPLKDKFTANSTMDNKYASEFYTKRDKLQVNANSMYATEQDTLMSMYMDEVSWDMSSLYKEKREVQNSDLSKKEKFERVQEIQNQINDLAKEALNTYDTGKYTDNYAAIGNYEFYKGTDYNGNEEWKTVYDYKVEELAELGMTSEEKNEYFMLKQEFDALNNEYYDTKDNLESTYGKHSDEFEDESDELYMEKKNTIIDTIMASNLTDDAKAYLYKEYYNSSDIDTITMSGIAVDYFLDYQKNDFKADYNSKGKAIPNSRKNKVIDYVNEFDLSVPEKAIIIKSTNTFKFNDYNDEIVSYIADLDISEEDKIYILQELDMTVDEDGYAHWE